jgi:uncharacterized membrane protein
VNTKQWVVGTIAGGIVLFVLGYVFFDLLLGDFYAANSGSATGVMREAPVFWAVGVGAIAYTVLVLYALRSQGASVSVATGMKTGAIVGCLIWLCADFTLYGITNMSNLTVTIVDPLVEIVRGGIMGAVLGMLLPKLA